MRKSAVVPYLAVTDAESAIDFFVRVLGAVETQRYQDVPGGRIGHATLEINGEPLFLSDEYPEISVLAPPTIGGSPVMMVHDVPDVDEAYLRAVAAGAVGDREPANQGNYMRNAKITDPFGHRWMFTGPVRE